MCDRDDRDHCPATRDGRHVVELSFANFDKMSEGLLLELACAACDRCGSVPVAEAEILWDDPFPAPVETLEACPATSDAPYLTDDDVPPEQRSAVETLDFGALLPSEITTASAARLIGLSPALYLRLVAVLEIEPVGFTLEDGHDGSRRTLLWSRDGVIDAGQCPEAASLRLQTARAGRRGAP